MSPRSVDVCIINLLPLKDLFLKTFQPMLGDYIRFINVDGIITTEAINQLNRDECNPFQGIREILTNFSIPSDVVKHFLEQFNNQLNNIFGALLTEPQFYGDYPMLEIRPLEGCLLRVVIHKPEPVISLGEMVNRVVNS